MDDSIVGTIRASCLVREHLLRRLRVIESIIAADPGDYESRGIRLYLIAAVKREAALTPNAYNADAVGD